MKNEQDSKSPAIPPLPPATGSAYWPIWKHMSDNHGLTLLDSECEDILQVADQMLMRRLDVTVANIQKNIRLVDTKLRVMTETLRQIANSGRNSTRDRRNARATLRFLDSLTKDTPNDKLSHPAEERQ
jgi:hypothetical protein